MTKPKAALVLRNEQPKSPMYHFSGEEGKFLFFTEQVALWTIIFIIVILALIVLLISIFKPFSFFFHSHSNVHAYAHVHSYNCIPIPILRSREIEQSKQVNTFLFLMNSCWSYVGRTGSKQQLSLARGCWRHGTIAHEIGQC